MNSEKMMILKMLEDGKITSEEASKLLLSLGENKTEYTTNDNSNFKSTPGKSDSNWTKDFGKKVEILTRDLEPKLQKITAVVAEKTSQLAEKLSHSLATPPKTYKTPSSSTPETSPPSTPVSSSPMSKAGKMERSFEYPVSADVANELNVTCLNGYIYLKGYNGDKITAKLIYEPKLPNASVELLKLGSTYYLNYDNAEFNSINMEAYIPSALFKNLQLETIGNRIAIDKINCDRINLYTENGEINIKDITTENLKAETTNAKISVDNITGSYVSIENYTGSVEVMSADTATLKIEASNAPVTVIIPYLAKYSNYQWRIQTSNAKLKMNLPTAPDTAYDLKAYTSLSEVVVGLTGLRYIQNEKNYIEASSLNIDTAHKKVRLNLDTSNAQLVINS